MKKLLKGVVVFILFVIFAICITGCGESADSLAREQQEEVDSGRGWYDLGRISSLPAVEPTQPGDPMFFAKICKDYNRFLTFGRALQASSEMFTRLRVDRAVTEEEYRKITSRLIMNLLLVYNQDSVSRRDAQDCHHTVGYYGLGRFRFDDDDRVLGRLLAMLDDDRVVVMYEVAEVLGVPGWVGVGRSLEELRRILQDNILARVVMRE